MKGISFKGRTFLRKIASGIVFWSGLAVIGVIAVPLAILAGFAILIWKGTDLLIKKLDNDS